MSPVVLVIIFVPWLVLLPLLVLALVMDARRKRRGKGADAEGGAGGRAPVTPADKED